ncbi:hypothetical protein K435DRAFT_973466 [Dendrothele bispora CBS 962.96]|uniref:Uncharacterized protein n=1 Tax=Dendrothele bispora (strain CBS 962.96) TaxID=1314807 RepID=A0A4S8KS73_DENBC|nr:hypothetical protein K435DRAFT_973466 [Dendrothele bispora CBS 962.96]
MSIHSIFSSSSWSSHSRPSIDDETSPTRLVVKLYDKCQELRNQKKLNALNPRDKAAEYTTHVENERKVLLEIVNDAFEAGILGEDEKDAFCRKLEEICQNLPDATERANSSSKATLGSTTMTHLKMRRHRA